MKVLARFPSPAGARPASGRTVLQATAVAAACLVAVGVVPDPARLERFTTARRGVA